MPSSLQKFAHGALSAGADLAGQTYLMDRRSEIQSARDKVLNEYRSQAENSRHSNNLDLEGVRAENNVNLENTRNDNRRSMPSEQRASAQLDDIETQRDLLKAYMDAKTPEDRKIAAQNIAAAGGRPSEGQSRNNRFLNTKDGVFDMDSETYVGRPNKGATEAEKRQATQLAKTIFESQVDARGNPAPTRPMKEIYHEALALIVGTDLNDGGDKGDKAKKTYGPVKIGESEFVHGKIYNILDRKSGETKRFRFDASKYDPDNPSSGFVKQ